MIGWGSILYGAALSALAAAIVVWLIRERRPPVVVSAALAAAAGPIAWNAILHHLDAREFFVDAPIPVFPVSWQDTGSGVFALAAATLILGLGVLRTATASTLTRIALSCAVAALLVDVYLY